MAAQSNTFLYTVYIYTTTLVHVCVNVCTILKRKTHIILSQIIIIVYMGYYANHCHPLHMYYTMIIFRFIECFETTFLHTHRSLLAKLGR